MTYLPPSYYQHHHPPWQWRSFRGCTNLHMALSIYLWWHLAPNLSAKPLEYNVHHLPSKKTHLFYLRPELHKVRVFHQEQCRAQHTAVSKTRCRLKWKRIKLCSKFDLLWFPHYPTCKVIISRGIFWLIFF